MNAITSSNNLRIPEYDKSLDLGKNQLENQQKKEYSKILMGATIFVALATLAAVKWSSDPHILAELKACNALRSEEPCNAYDSKFEDQPFLFCNGSPYRPKEIKEKINNIVTDLCSLEKRPKFDVQDFTVSNPTEAWEKAAHEFWELGDYEKGMVAYIQASNLGSVPAYKTLKNLNENFADIPGWNEIIAAHKQAKMDNKKHQKAFKK